MSTPYIMINFKLLQYLITLLLTISPIISWGNNELDDQPEVVKIAYFELPPHIEKGPDGKLKGPALEYVKLILKEMDIEHFTLNGFPVQRAFQMLVKGEADIVLFAAKTPNTIREDFILTDLDVTSTQPGLIVTKNHHLSEPLEFSQLVGNDLAFWSGGFVPQFLQHESINLIKIAGEEVYKRGFMLVKHDRVDGFFHVDSMALEWWLETSGQSQYLKLLKLPNTVRVKSIFSKASDQRFRLRYEAALENVQQRISYRDFFFDYQKNN